MHTYIITYKEHDKEWSSTTYTDTEPVSMEFLVQFFDLEKCEDYQIEEAKYEASKN